MPVPRGHRFPIGAARNIVEDRYGPASESAFAALVAIDRAQIHRDELLGGFTFITADRVAVHLGLHPSCIWPEWFDVALAESRQQSNQEQPEDRNRRTAAILA